MKIRKSILTVSLMLIFPCFVYADTIYLKNGESIKGKIKEKTGTYLVINVQGFDFSYLLNDTQRIEENGIEEKMDVAPSKADGCAKDGLKYALQKEYTEAIISYQKAIIYNPNDVQYYKMLGHVYELNLNNKKAVEIYKKALEIFPDNKEIMDDLSAATKQ